MDHIHVVTYIDLAAKGVEPALAALKRYRTAARGETGNTAVTVFQEIGRPDRLAVIETWADPASHDAHRTAASTTALAANIDFHVKGAEAFSSELGIGIKMCPCRSVRADG